VKNAYQGLIAIIAALYLTGVPSVQAYGTIGMAGQNHEHQKITRLALSEFGIGNWTMDQLAGTDKSMGAIGAADNPMVGVVFRPEAHCDRGDHLDTEGYPQSAAEAEKALNTCRNWIFHHLGKAIAIAPDLLEDNKAAETENRKNCTFRFDTGTAKCRVLFELGLAFHATQDFYAHSNWTDIATGDTGADNPPGLAQNGPSTWLDPVTPPPLPKGLLTGCWEGVPEIFFCSQLSKHKRVTHATVNKDTGAIDLKSGQIGKGTTPRGAQNDNFRRSVTVAIADTRQKWQYFEAQILATYGPEKGRRILCLIKSDPHSVCK